MAKPCLHFNDNLANLRVLKMLQNPEDGWISHLPPVKPKACEVYIFSPAGNNNECNGQSMCLVKVILLGYWCSLLPLSILNFYNQNSSYFVASL